MKSVEEGTGKYFKRRKRGRYLCEFCEQDEQYSQHFVPDTQGITENVFHLTVYFD